MVCAKAGQPCWAAIVPIYDIYVLTQIVGREAWWTVVVLIVAPAFILLAIDLARSFGKGTGFGLGIAFLSPIFIGMLAFGDAEYKGPSARAGAAMLPSLQLKYLSQASAWLPLISSSTVPEYGGLYNVDRLLYNEKYGDTPHLTG